MSAAFILALMLGNACVTGWLVARVQALRERLEDVDACVSWMGQEQQKMDDFISADSPIVEVTPKGEKECDCGASAVASDARDR